MNKTYYCPYCDKPIDPRFSRVVKDPITNKDYHSACFRNETLERLHAKEEMMGDEAGTQ